MWGAEWSEGERRRESEEGRGERVREMLNAYVIDWHGEEGYPQLPLSVPSGLMWYVATVACGANVVRIEDGDGVGVGVGV